MLLENQGKIAQIMLGPFFGFIYGPLYYTYTKSLTIETTNLKKLAFHFIPAFLILPLLFSSKFQNAINIIGLLATVHFVVYLLMALKLISSYRRQLYNATSSFHKISLFWLVLIIYLQLVIIFVSLLESYFQAIINTDLFILLIYIFTLILIHCFYFLGLKQIRLFKGFKETDTESGVSTEYSIPEDVFNDYVDKLTIYFNTEKPYLEFDITLQDISDKLSISPRNLSHIINKKFKMNYYNFINHYRLELAKQSLNESEKSIKEIMYDSGFSNKATFYSVFKKNTGSTPSEFRKMKKSKS
ncbi:MAG: AraC family transcriptional regulator [Algoriphagus sp.]|uniref:helix-turn-helix domain-containing protein n=1 Tax=Algoriphagus sp. TaxID=1872435 RepID=UPI001836D70E|nr:helix-turn-helix domain-containing protein [Algoriphagus sp.]NVJ86688.1 AraC family transcriptional regulator [Algoriphagus sp.]